MHLIAVTDMAEMVEVLFYMSVRALLLTNLALNGLEVMLWVELSFYHTKTANGGINRPPDSNNSTGNQWNNIDLAYNEPYM